jgi:beta-barrel assembly-enhancing protease
MKKIVIELGILLAIGLVIWLVVARLNFLPENPQLVSVATEEKIGEKYLEIVTSDASLQQLENEKADSMLNAMGQFLAENLEKASFSYHFYLIDNEMVNAFSLPGGNILVTKGLVDYCNTTEELLAVIAHEIGHSEKRHVISRLVKEIGLEILLSGDDFVVGEAGKILVSSGFNRKQEEHADQFACELLLKAKVEPRIMASLFRRLKDEQEIPELEKFEIVSSHPNMSSRIKKILGFTLPNGFEAQTLPFSLDALKAELM